LPSLSHAASHAATTAATATTTTIQHRIYADHPLSRGGTQIDNDERGLPPFSAL